MCPRIFNNLWNPLSIHCLPVSRTLSLSFVFFIVESGIQLACHAGSTSSSPWGLRLLILLSFFTEICASFLLVIFGVYSDVVVVVAV